MSAFPSTVRVGIFPYRVLTDRAAINAASEGAEIGEGCEWAAFSDHDSLVIGINADNPLPVQQRDLIHELLHCCLRHSGVEPNAYASVVGWADGRHDGYTVEEFTVAALSVPLLTVFRDNPDLTAWLDIAPRRTP